MRRADSRSGLVYQRTFDNLGILKALLPYFWSWRGRISAALLCLLIAKLSNLVVPLLFKKIVDYFLLVSNQTTELLALSVPVLLLCAYATLRFCSTLFVELRELLFIRVTQNAMRQLALDVFNHLHVLSLKFHLDRQTGAVARDIDRGTRSLASLVSYGLYSILPTLVEVGLVVTYFVLNYEIWFAVITLVALISYVIFTIVITQWRIRFRRTMNELDSKANAQAIDALLNYETVKYFGNEVFEADRYNISLMRYEKAAIQSQTSLSLLNMGQSLIIVLAVFMVLWRSSLGVVTGTMTLGDLVLVNAMMLQLYMPLNFLGVVYRELKQALTDVDRLFFLLGIKPEVSDCLDAQPLNLMGAGVRFSGVGFAYDVRRPVLHDISFEIPAGKTVAVVGESGAGKSTLVRLLFRFYDVSAGSIQIDGQDIRLVSQRSLRQAIGIVPQDTVLFNDTIANNIAYGRVDATQADIEEAARLAHIHHFIMSLPECYETRVGERGLKLSGGEKQRVAIARAVLKNPGVLVFDEASSALDTHSEQIIQMQLQALCSHRTTLIIAHRLSTVIHADIILVMKEGRIVERGTHQVLLNAGGLYAKMWESQQSEVMMMEPN